MSIFERKHTAEVTLNEGNNIRGDFDFRYCYDSMPAGAWTVEHNGDYCETLWFLGDGHGAEGNYGNGSVAVQTSRAPDWLLEHLGIKRNRRVGERRGRR